MTRRAALFLPIFLWADERTDVLDAVTPLAAALINGDADEFMRHIHEDCPNRRELADNVRDYSGKRRSHRPFSSPVSNRAGRSSIGTCRSRVEPCNP